MEPGDKFGRLTVRRLFHERSSAGKSVRMVEAKCDCGRLKTAREGDIRSGQVRSCGCFRRDATAARSTTHGQSKAGERTELYKLWSAMHDRCRRSPFYVGRQVRVCDEWLDFNAFEAYVVEALGTKPKGYSLDRIDNDRDYEPGNVRYGSPTDQARNRRSNTLLTVRGETLCVAEWAERMGYHSETILQRKRLGWSDEKAVLKPLRKKK